MVDEIAGKKMSKEEIDSRINELTEQLRVKEEYVQRSEHQIVESIIELNRRKSLQLKNESFPKISSQINMLIKIKLFINKYLPDVLIQIGLFVIVTNGGLKSILPKIDPDATPFAVFVFIGINIAIRRYLIENSSVKE